MELAGFRIDEEGLDLVAVAPEQRVRERAVAPVDAGAVEVHQQRRHRVQQPVAIWTGAEREAHQQPPVLDRIREVFGDQDRAVALGRRRQPNGRDGRQAGPFEVAQDVELRSRHAERLLLEREGQPVHHEEPDQVAGRSDRNVPEAQRIRRPGRKGRFPGQVEQLRATVAQPQPWEAGRGDRVGQSFLRR